MLNRLSTPCAATSIFPRPTKNRDLAVARYFFAQSRRRINRSLEDLWDNDDAQTTAIAIWRSRQALSELSYINSGIGVPRWPK